MKKLLRIGSRESRLAVRQTEIMIEQLKKADSELSFELVTMKTSGDRILNQRLDHFGGKGLFVKELDEALRMGEIDLAVHSLKDMPMEMPEDLPIAAYSLREDPRDVLIYRSGANEALLQRGSIIGSASPRRILQLKKLYPNCEFKTIRGNLQTRLYKLENDAYHATVLAAAGIERLKMNAVIGRYFSVQEMIPAAGQGIIAVQGRKGEYTKLLSDINSFASQAAATAERSFVRELGGGCASPIAAYAEIKGERLVLNGLYAEPEEKGFLTGQLEGSVQEAERIGIRLARLLKG